MSEKSIDQENFNRIYEKALKAEDDYYTKLFGKPWEFEVNIYTE